MEFVHTSGLGSEASHTATAGPPSDLAIAAHHRLSNAADDPIGRALAIGQVRGFGIASACIDVLVKQSGDLREVPDMIAQPMR
jgi:hypothetical protein